MNQKAKYIEFCEKYDVPLHLQPWWLDIVCGGHENWDVALTFDANGGLTGALPFYFTKKLGWQIVKMPPLTDYAGITFNLDNQGFRKKYKQEAIEQQIIADLVRQLPQAAYFYQQFYPELDNWLPFYWAGFRQTTTYTYQLENLENLEIIYDNFKSSVRTNIRNAEKQVQSKQSNDVSTFYKIYTHSLERRQVRIPFTFEIFQKLDKILAEKQQRRIYLACDLQNESLHAGLYVAWDNKTAYFLLWGIESEKKQSHAIQLLFWQAIQDLSGKVEKVDFCGSMIPSMERMIRSFGGTRRACFCIYKSKNKFFELLGLLLNRSYY